MNFAIRSVRAAVMLAAIGSQSDAKTCAYLFIWDVGNFSLVEGRLLQVPDGTDCPNLTAPSFFDGDGVPRHISPAYDGFIDLNGSGAPFPGSSFTMDGIVTFTEFDSELALGVENTGVWEIRDDSDMTSLDPLVLFENRGLFAKSGGSGVTRVQSRFHDTGGEIEVASGTIRFEDDDTRFNATTFSGGGTIEITGQADFFGQIAWEPGMKLVVDGGVVSGAGGPMTQPPQMTPHRLG